MFQIVVAEVTKRRNSAWGVHPVEATLSRSCPVLGFGSMRSRALKLETMGKCFPFSRIKELDVICLVDKPEIMSLISVPKALLLSGYDHPIASTTNPPCLNAE
jgi:hypothetical protein